MTTKVMYHEEKQHDAQAHILRLNVAGSPIEWLTWQEATTLYARNLVTWTLGDTIRTVWGGTSRFSGKRSSISLHSIIACAGELHGGKAPGALSTLDSVISRWAIAPGSVRQKPGASAPAADVPTQIFCVDGALAARDEQTKSNLWSLEHGSPPRVRLIPCCSVF